MPPRNALIHNDPCQTIIACRQVIDWLAHIEQPFEGEEMDVAEAYVMRTVVDALGHAELVTSQLWKAAGNVADEVKS
jgi:hypothetical protein